MSDVEEKPVEEPKQLVQLEQAKSARSTCKITSEKIDKDEWRVGMEAFSGGRVSVNWMKLVPFLQHCGLDQARGRAAKCKVTGYTFGKGETRFYCAIGSKSKSFLTLPAAHGVLAPVLEQAGREFKLTGFQGLEDLPEGPRAAFAEAFKVPKGEMAAFNKQHPPPDPVEAAPKRKKAKISKDQPAGAANGHASGSEGVGEDQDAPSAPQNKAAEAGRDEINMQADIDQWSEPEEGEVDYEKQRQELIARNRARMAELNLPSLAAQLIPQPKKKPAAQKGVRAKKKEKKPTTPTRASLRVQGITADGAYIVDEGRGAKFTIEHAPGAPPNHPPGESPPPPEPKHRHPQGPVPFESLAGTKHIDEAMLEKLRGMTKQSTSKPSLGKAMAKFSMQETGVAKVTHNGVVHIAFHPGCDRLLAACAAKNGHVGLWDVNHSPVAPEGNEDADDDGVVELAPHNQYVSGLRWAGGLGSHARLFSCSYDGSIRRLDPTTGVFDPILLSKDAEWSAMDTDQAGNAVYVGENEGDLAVYDPRTSKPVLAPFNVLPKKFNTLHVEPGSEHLLLGSCGDGGFATWDIRKLGRKMKAVASASHSRTCSSAYFDPTGSEKVLTTSRDNTLAVWDAKRGLDMLASVGHNNNTGRWVVPFRASWGPAGDAIMCGSMGRQVDLYDAAKGAQLGSLSSEYMTAIVSRAVAHPHLPALVAGSASGRLHLFQ